MTSSYLPETIPELVKLLGLIPHPEGGYFRETWRSGSAPMVTRGMTATEAPAKDLVTRQEDSGQRNCLTSIFWVPTVEDPRLLLSTLKSDHVHYYQGGRPFQYTLFNTISKTLETVILGPDIQNGHQLQLAIEGGTTFKCGKILMDENHDKSMPPYTIIAEAVGPGFDVTDFVWVTSAQLKATDRDDVYKALSEYVHPEERKVGSSDTEKLEHFDKHYDKE